MSLNKLLIANNTLKSKKARSALMAIDTIHAIDMFLVKDGTTADIRWREVAVCIHCLKVYPCPTMAAIMQELSTDLHTTGDN